MQPLQRDCTLPPPAAVQKTHNIRSMRLWMRLDSGVSNGCCWPYQESDFVNFPHRAFRVISLRTVATTIELILVSLIKPALLAAWPSFDNKRQGALLSLTFAGEMAGGLVWGLLSDRIGRRWTFLGTSAMAALFGTAAALSPCFYTFTMARFLLGFAIGGSLSIDIIYFVEFVPARSRGLRTIPIILFGIMACMYHIFDGRNPFHFNSLLYGCHECPLSAKVALVRLCLWLPKHLVVPGADLLALGIAKVSVGP